VRKKEIKIAELSKEQLRELQMIQLDILLEADRVCKENGIKYSLSSGTLLGAVRHKGCIPWDDDTDIELLRSEYEKFAKIFDDATDSTKYYFQDADNTPGYRWGYGKIRRKNTLWLRSGQEHLPFNQEICIDIIPLDKVPDNIIASRFHNLHCFIIRKIMWSEVGKYYDDNPFYRILYCIMSKIPLSSVINHYHRFTEINNKKDYKHIRFMTYPTPRGSDHNGEIEWYNSFTELVYEGKMLRTITEYDDYLRQKYGDYMTIPPENERRNSPASKFQLLDDNSTEGKV